MTTGPLHGLCVREDGRSLAGEVAAWFLSGLGAAVDRRSTGVRLAALADLHEAVRPNGLPPATVDYATGLALAAATVLGAIGGREIEVSRLETAAHLLLPDVMAASYGAPEWTRPAAPLPCGEGALAVDLGPDDQDALSRLLATLEPDEASNPETVAARAQGWRLPVLPYRRRPWPVGAERAVVHGCGWTRAPRACPEPMRSLEPVTGPPLEGVVVCDLTAVWAGPLATWLLAACGAEVWKVEPDCRPDGFRALDGRGIHPDGVLCTDGNRSALFNAVNRNKRRVPLDLRRDDDRERFRSLVSRADLVVDAFSPRVMPNLGLERRRLVRIRPDVLTLSMPAFGPASPHRHWVAYGTGVHAITGLGDTGRGFAAPSVSYPDVLAGLAAFATAVALVYGRARGWDPRHVEVPLESATLPLLRLHRREHAPCATALDGAALLGHERLAERGFFRELADSAGVHRYPRAPFRGEGVTVADLPAPTLEADGTAP